MTDGKKLVISLTALRTGKVPMALPGGERLTLSLSQGETATVVRELSC